MGLFRQQALDASRERLHGDIVLLPRISHALLCLLLVTWAAAAAAFLTQASYSRKETVRGWLEPAAGMVRVYPLGEGRLQELLVDTGDRVAAGQALAIINGDRTLPGGQQLEKLLLQEYRHQQENLERQIERARAMERLRERELKKRRDAARQEAAQLDEKIRLLDQRVSLARDRRQRHRPLAVSGHVTRAEVDDLLERQLVLETERRELGLQRLRQEALVHDVEAALERLPGEFAETLDRLRLQLSELSQEIAQLRGNRGHVVQAPLAGEVASVGAAAGQRARYDKPILTLLPAASPLVVRLLVPVRAAGFLREGQSLAIRYDAFPYQKYGLQQGLVVHLTRSTMLPGDQAHWPVYLNEPVFRVTAKLAHSTISSGDERLTLRAGMTLSADVILERRSLLQWLLEPLKGLGARLS